MHVWGNNIMLYNTLFVQFNSETMKWEGNPCNDPTVQVMAFKKELCAFLNVIIVLCSVFTLDT